MTQKRISPVKGPAAQGAVPIRVTMITLDGHMSSAVERAGTLLRGELPGLDLSVHAVSDWGADGAAAEACRADIARADIVVAHMIFLEEHALKLAPWLEARREDCDCMVGAMSAADVVKKTRLGDFNMAKPTGGAIGLLKRLRGKSKNGVSAGRGQMKMLRQLPKVLKYIPGKAQDVRAYFLTLQYLLAGSDENIANLIRFLVGRYATGERAALRDAVRPAEPRHYPDVGLYHPALTERVSDDIAALPALKGATGTVGLLLMRSYILADNTAHYDGVIAALEAKGLRVVPAFASGLDARPAIDAYFMRDGRATVDAVVSLTGFSLVGGPAYNDSAAAEEALAALDVPYLSAFAVEFQTLEEWEAGDHGLTPVETTMMVSLPEIDGATGPILFGGRSRAGGTRDGNGQDMVCHGERTRMLAARVAKLVSLRATPKAERRIATVIYNFPPNGGAIGTAAHLSVFRSLWNSLRAMKDEGYTVDLPADADALRDAILGGNAALHGMDANVAARVSADTHVARESRLEELEAQWGPAPGRHLSDGSDIFVLGAHFGNVFVGVQPAFGYEGDPMRLLFEKGFTPTHAFAAFYGWLREEYRADAILHFGTHGALEFMPGKQAGMSAACWPDYLIGAMPNLYLYACNNPSEGTIARRRSAATLVSYLTPPVGHAGLYKGLLDLKGTIDRWRAVPPGETEEAARLAETVREMAVAIDLVEEGAAVDVAALAEQVREYETALIPHGLHVVGEAPGDAERRDFLGSANEALGEHRLDAAALDAIAAGDAVRGEAAVRLAALDAGLRANGDAEIGALLRALDGRYIRPVSGGDIVRAPEIVPTGRNIHAFDPFRMPSPFALKDGARQAQRLIDRYIKDHGAPPRSVALVLWGTDTMKTEGAPIAQALSLIGARPRFDGFGRLAGADLIPLEELGRPRIDVTMTLSGIFRDLLPLHTKLLAEASLLAAKADEALGDNAIRAHALAYAKERQCDIETAALRVFSNAAGAYGSNVNMLIDGGMWEDGDEIAETYTSRKCFAYGVDGRPVKQSELLSTILRDVDASYQNIDSVEVSVTSVDHYFDTLGGISRAVKKAGGKDLPVYVGDQTTGAGKVRALSEQVALETRTRTLNPKWYEALLDHGYEGVRQIESHVTNTFGWSATTGQVDPWVYKTITENFVLDEAMRNRLADLNPKASAKLANRLIEAGERNFWTPDDETWAALRAAGDELEDRVEGIIVETAA